MIKLGDKVKDSITGFTGVVTGITTWLNGCVRIGVQHEKLKDGVPSETQWIDDVQLRVIIRGKVAAIPPGPSGGLEEGRRRRDPTRAISR